MSGFLWEWKPEVVGEPRNARQNLRKPGQATKWAELLRPFCGFFAFALMNISCFHSRKNE